MATFKIHQQELIINFGKTESLEIGQLAASFDD